MVSKTHDAEAGGPIEEIPHDHLFRVTGLSSNNLEKMAEEAPKATEFEDAIAATHYGKFNICLMFSTMTAFWSAVTVTSSPSYIFTKAICDMQLSLLDMGTVNAMTYVGMISSAMLWGFLSDTLGRKKIMVWGFLMTGLLEVTASLSQNFVMLLVTRYFCGFLFNGPFAVLISYLAEMHRTDLRAQVILLSSLFYTIANVTLPLLAWGVLTHDFTFSLFGGLVAFHSWNLFLMIGALMPALAGLSFIFLPESPKFLMSRGRNDEALNVFRKLFAMNTGHPVEDYPIKLLVEEKSGEQAQGLAALRGGFQQLTPLFKRPYLCWLLLMCFIQIGAMFGSNTLRLWFPQLAAMIEMETNADLCSAIAPSNVTTVLIEDEICQPMETTMSTYIQSAVVGSGTIVTYCIGGFLVNKCGKKIVAGTCGVCGAILTIMVPLLATETVQIVCIVMAILGFTAMLGATLSSIMVDLFPTDLRVMGLAIFLMCGRLGTILGTVTFPALIDFGCYPPFIAIAAVLAICGLAITLVPDTTLKKLQ